MTIMKQCLTKNSSKSRQGSESRRKRPGKMIAPGTSNHIKHILYYCGISQDLKYV